VSLQEKASLRRAIRVAEDIKNLALSANGNSSEALQEIELLSAHIGKRFGQKETSMAFESANEATGEAETEWLVKGYVLEGGIAALSAKVKMGKTTLITHMVKAILSDKPFLGARTKRTPVVYLTEQPRVSFKIALQRAGLTDETNLRILYFNQTLRAPWTKIAADAGNECKRIGAKLLIVDTLAQFAGLVGDSENDSGALYEAVRPLQAIGSQGVGILLSCHDRKSGGEVGDATRGSSALTGVVDIILSLRRPEGNSRKSLRVIQSLSRFDETPEELVIDLTDEGYIALGEKADVALQEAREAILAACPTSEADAQNLKDLCASADATRQTGQRALDEFVLNGKVQKIGNGKRGDPFRYFLTEKVSAQTSSIDWAERNEQRN
jgi:predicted ATP-dependent serine protease